MTATWYFQAMNLLEKWYWCNEISAYNENFLMVHSFSSNWNTRYLWLSYIDLQGENCKTFLFKFPWTMRWESIPIIASKIHVRSKTLALIYLVLVKALKCYDFTQYLPPSMASQNYVVTIIMPTYWNTSAWFAIYS